MERKTVTLALLATFLIIVTDKALVHKQFPKPRILIALTVAFIFLGFMAEYAPDVAAAFAILIFVSVLLSQGVDVFNGLSKAIR
jgi:hypothetical protein